MNWRISFLLFLFVFAACEHTEKTTPKKAINYLIEVDEVQKIIKNPSVKIIDFRKPTDYAKEHLEKALNIWRTDIEDGSFPYKGMMASAKKIEALFSRLGIKTGDMLVIYDDKGLVDATRLWWILQNYDYTNVKLLNGGLTAWEVAKGKTTDATAAATLASNFKLTKNPSFRFHNSKKGVLKALKGNTFLLDTRTQDEFSGKNQKKGAFKGGRIPNSILINWVEAIDYNGTKKMKSKKELRQIYGRLPLNKNDTIIVYCHSGVRSAHTTFVLTQLLGYKNVTNYDGSWTEWSYFDELPFVKDSLTTKF